MTHFVADESAPSRMRVARSAAEFVLFGIREITARFDREGVARSIREGIAFIYRAMDAGPDSLVQPEALSQAATSLGAARERLLNSVAKRTFQVDRAAAILADAQGHLQAASEVVAFDQLARRMELPWGSAEEVTHTEPFRTSHGTPQLFALRREPIAPALDLGEAEPEPEPHVAPPPPRTVSSIEEARSLAKELFSAASDVREEEPAPTTADDSADDSATEEASNLDEFSANDTEQAMVAEIARDIIEDIASLGSLRHPIETESWLDQAPFEQRLLDRLDYFCSFGHGAMRAAVLYYAETADAPDLERAFAFAFALGCIRGNDPIDAVVTTICQSPPEVFPGFVEGLVLASNPVIDDAMRTLLQKNEPRLVELATEVLSKRRALALDDLQWTTESGDARVQELVAQALGTNLDREQALAQLNQIYTTAEPGGELHLLAIESGLRRGCSVARNELRRLLATPGGFTNAPRAAALLGLSGNARDLELVQGAAQLRVGPMALEGLGRLGHVGAAPFLLQLIDEGDEAWAPIAANELERITGAGLFEEVEEPWVKELPPEAAEMDVPIPKRKVRRVSLDPQRWHAWEREHASRFDPTKKYRLGAPFTPAQLLAELEALDLRADERERAALELCAATGQDFDFRADTWVAEQQRALGRMRDYLGRHTSEPGAWCYGGAALSVRPELRRATDSGVAPIAPIDSPLESEIPEFLRQGGSLVPLEPLVVADGSSQAFAAPDDSLPVPQARWESGTPPSIAGMEHDYHQQQLAAQTPGAPEWSQYGSSVPKPLLRIPSEVPEGQPDALLGVHFASTPQDGPIRFLAGSASYGAVDAPVKKRLIPVEPPRADAIRSTEQARLSGETPRDPGDSAERDPAAPPPYLEPSPADAIPAQRLLKKLPWEK